MLPEDKPRKPYCKPTREEADERLQYTIHLVGRCVYKGEIKRMLRERYGVTHWSAERYLRRARSVLRQRFGPVWDEQRPGSIAFWESVIRDPSASLRNKMFAQRRLDILFGLTDAASIAEEEARTRQPAGKAFHRFDLADAKVRELFADVAELVAGLPLGPAQAPSAPAAPAPAQTAAGPQQAGEAAENEKPAKRTGQQAGSAGKSARIATKGSRQAKRKGQGGRRAAAPAA